MKQFSGNSCAETAVSLALEDEKKIDDAKDFYNLVDQEITDDAKDFYSLMDHEMIDDMGVSTTWPRVCEFKVCYIAMQDNISSQSSLYKSKLLK